MGMNKKVLIVTPSLTVGGLGSYSMKIYNALLKEGLTVELCDLGTKKYVVLHTFLNDLNCLFKKKEDFDMVMYIGSIPYPSSFFFKLLGKKIVVVVNGYFYYEVFNEIKRSIKLKKIRRILISLLNLLLFEIGKKYVDVYVYPCYGAREAVRTGRRSHVVPLWIDESEQKLEIRDSTSYDLVRVITYTSYVYSPKILPIEAIIKIFKIVENKINKNFELTIIDPRLTGEKHRIKDLTLRRGKVILLSSLPRDRFLSLLSHSHLYFDPIIDDEFRYSTLEAMALGVPIAKLVHSKYIDKLEFRYELISDSIGALIKNIVNYIENLEDLYPKYSQFMKSFVQSQRTWKAVKHKLLSALYD